MQIHGLTLEFFMLQNEGLDGKKNNMRHVHYILHPLKRRGGARGGSWVGYVLAVSASVTFLKVYFGPTNLYYNL